MIDAMPRGIDPKLTERYLLGMGDILDASVWWDHGSLRACVTVVDSTPITDQEIKQKCVEELGLHQTPRAITFYGRRAAENSQMSSSSSISSFNSSMALSDASALRIAA